MPLDISSDERRVLAGLIARIAGRDLQLAEHALACGALSATLARMLDLPDRRIARASILGTLHEVGSLAHGDDPDDVESRAAWPERQRRLRAATVRLIGDEPVLAEFAEPAGTLFDDVVPSIEARIVVVADIFDAIVRSMPGIEGLGKRGALDVLSALAGPRVDGEVVQALIFSQRRTIRRTDVSA
jgi:HD-GYP domain-containing protein (c-di-GMP phosphodiesterase class II)